MPAQSSGSLSITLLERARENGGTAECSGEDEGSCKRSERADGVARP